MVLSLLLLLAPTSLGISLRGPDGHTVCHNDLDCEDVSATSGEDYRCFSYLCLAWNISSVPERENSSTSACYNSWDCVEGMVCLKHPDEEVDKGFCIEELVEMHACADDSDCQGQGQELVCVPPGACGDPSYRDLLDQLPCSDDSDCWLDRGDQCCPDFSQWRGQGLDSLDSRCCQLSPAVLPPTTGYTLTQELLEQLEEYGKCLMEKEPSAICSHNMTTVVGLDNQEEGEEQEQEQKELEQEQGEGEAEDVPHQDRLHDVAGSDKQGPTLLLILLSGALLTLTR